MESVIYYNLLELHTYIHIIISFQQNTTFQRKKKLKNKNNF